jgi:hypothetical protein
MMAPHARERGSTLIISLVFLLVFLVMALSIFRGALTSSQAIGNMQWRNEAISAANETIDLLLSNANVATQTPTVVAQVNANGGIPYDINGDNAADVIVRFPTIAGVTGPQCLRVRPIPATELSPSRAEDAGCFTSSTAGGIAVEGGGGATPASGPSSLCANSEWSMTVRATDASTSTSVDVTQGFAVRVPTVSIPAECE